MQAEPARRITGPHLVLPEPGAAIELTFATDDDAASIIDEIGLRAVRLADALGWDARYAFARWDGGATVGLTAPPDLLDAAADALDAAVAGVETPDDELRRRTNDAISPGLRSLLNAAAEQDVAVLLDDDGFTLGLGALGQTWALDALPDVAEVARFAHENRVPVVAVTGTNGKTTTTRMITRIAEQAGFPTGHTSSDGVRVAGTWLERGDWSGPGAARTLLRDKRVLFAVLELARGGMMRRGLPLTGIEAAVITNVSADHLGEYGLNTVADLARAKVHVGRALGRGGALVINADCLALWPAVGALLEQRPDLRLLRFGLIDADPDDPLDATVRDGHLYALGHDLGPVTELPATASGTASHNVENALAAALVTLAIGLPAAAARDGLRAFRTTTDASRGRLNRLSLNGATIVLDYCHNPDGLRRLGEMANAWPAARRTLVFGQAGDRTDALLTALGATAASHRFDHYIVKRLAGLARGQAAEQVVAKLVTALRESGASPSAISVASDELDATEQVLARLAPGDLVLLLVHEQLDDVLALLTRAGATEIG